MQLANIEMDVQLFLNERCKEVLRIHGVLESDYEWFLKPAPESKAYLAQCFELSSAWLNGNTETVTEPTPRPHSIETFYKYVLHCKQMGLKPKIIFVKSEAEKSYPASVSILIELSKISPVRLAFTAYKQWDVEVWEEVLTLCQYASLPYLGLNITNIEYNRLKRHRMMPIEVLKKPLGLWFPQSCESTKKLYFSDKIIDFSEHIRYAVVNPTSWQNTG